MAYFFKRNYIYFVTTLLSINAPSYALFGITFDDILDVADKATDFVGDLGIPLVSSAAKLANMAGNGIYDAVTSPAPNATNTPPTTTAVPAGHPGESTVAPTATTAPITTVALPTDLTTVAPTANTMPLTSVPFSPDLDTGRPPMAYTSIPTITPPVSCNCSPTMVSQASPNNGITTPDGLQPLWTKIKELMIQMKESSRKMDLQTLLEAVASFGTDDLKQKVQYYMQENQQKIEELLQKMLAGQNRVPTPLATQNTVAIGGKNYP